MTTLFQHLAPGANGDTEITGSGLRVYTVLSLYEVGQSAEYIADAYDVPIAAVFEALAYAAEHSDEMETIRRADDEVDERTLNQLPERLRHEVEEVRRADQQAYQEAVRQAKEGRLGTLVP